MKTVCLYEIIYLRGVPIAGVVDKKWFHRYLVTDPGNIFAKILFQNEMRRQENSYLYIETVRPDMVEDLMEKYELHKSLDFS